jgi:hypothetical protein
MKIKVKTFWGKSEKKRKGASPSPFIGHQVLEPFNCHQVGIFFHLLPSPLSFTSFLFLFFKWANSNHLKLSLSRHNFLFKSKEYLFPQPFLVRKD